MNSGAVQCRTVLGFRDEKVDQTNFPKGKHMNIRRSFLALAAMILGVGFFGALPQQAQAQTVPSCVPKTSTSSNYPLDNVHAMSCLPAGYTNSVMSKSQIETAVFGAIQSLPTNNGGTTTKRPRDFLQSQGVVVFIFKNRAEANTWMSMNSPYNTSIFQTTTSRCGNTASNQTGIGIGQNIALMVYAECTYARSSEANRDVRATALHEAGHAWEFALASTKLIGRTNVISASPAFTALLNEDIAKLTPSNWSTRTQAQKNSYICNVFGSATATPLEIDLGSPSGAVCTGTTPNGTNGSKTPQQIMQERAPYFLPGSDQWAEQTKIKKDGISSDILTTTDKALGSNTAPRQNFKCARYALLVFYDTSEPPTAAQLMSQGCPTTQMNFNYP